MMPEQRYEPDQPHSAGGRFGSVSQKRPPHGGPESGHPAKPGQSQGPPRVVPTKSEFGDQQTPQTDVQAQQTQQDVPLPSGLSPDQEKAVQAWLGPDQPNINAEAASRNPGPYASVIESLESAILQAPALDHDQLVYRGLPAGDLSAVVKPHAVLTSPGFTPTSTTALPMMVRAMEVAIPRGSKVLELPGELLLPRGARIRIDDVPSNGNIAATYMGPSMTSKRSLPTDYDLQLARYRSLWFQANTVRERQAILDAVRRLQQT